MSIILLVRSLSNDPSLKALDKLLSQLYEQNKDMENIDILMSHVYRLLMLIACMNTHLQFTHFSQYLASVDISNGYFLPSVWQAARQSKLLDASHPTDEMNYPEDTDELALLFSDVSFYISQFNNLLDIKYSPLMLACKFRNDAVVRFLCEDGANQYGVDINYENYGLDALYYALSQESALLIEIIRLLIRNGAQVKQIHIRQAINHLLNPMDTEAESESLEILKLLLSTHSLTYEEMAYFADFSDEKYIHVHHIIEENVEPQFIIDVFRAAFFLQNIKMLTFLLKNFKDIVLQKLDVDDVCNYGFKFELYELLDVLFSHITVDENIIIKFIKNRDISQLKDEIIFLFVKHFPNTEDFIYQKLQGNLLSILNSILNVIFFIPSLIINFVFWALSKFELCEHKSSKMDWMFFSFGPKQQMEVKIYDNACKA